MQQNDTNISTAKQTPEEGIRLARTSEDILSSVGQLNLHAEQIIELKVMAHDILKKLLAAECQKGQSADVQDAVELATLDSYEEAANLCTADNKIFCKSLHQMQQTFQAILDLGKPTDLAAAEVYDEFVNHELMDDVLDALEGRANAEDLARLKQMMAQVVDAAALQTLLMQLLQNLVQQESVDVMEQLETMGFDIDPQTQQLLPIELKDHNLENLEKLIELSQKVNDGEALETDFDRFMNRYTELADLDSQKLLDQLAKDTQQMQTLLQEFGELNPEQHAAMNQQQEQLADLQTHFDQKPLSETLDVLNQQMDELTEQIAQQTFPEKITDRLEALVEQTNDTTEQLAQTVIEPESIDAASKPEVSQMQTSDAKLSAEVEVSDATEPQTASQEVYEQPMEEVVESAPSAVTGGAIEASVIENVEIATNTDGQDAPPVKPPEAAIAQPAVETEPLAMQAESFVQAPPVAESVHVIDMGADLQTPEANPTIESLNPVMLESLSDQVELVAQTSENVKLVVDNAAELGMPEPVVETDKQSAEIVDILPAQESKEVEATPQNPTVAPPELSAESPPSMPIVTEAVTAEPNVEIVDVAFQQDPPQQMPLEGGESQEEPRLEVKQELSVEAEKGPPTADLQPDETAGLPNEPIEYINNPPPLPDIIEFDKVEPTPSIGEMQHQCKGEGCCDKSPPPHDCNANCGCSGIQTSGGSCCGQTGEHTHNAGGDKKLELDTSGNALVGPGLAINLNISLPVSQAGTPEKTTQLPSPPLIKASLENRAKAA